MTKPRKLNRKGGAKRDARNEAGSTHHLQVSTPKLSLVGYCTESKAKLLTQEKWGQTRLIGTMSHHAWTNALNRV